MKKIISITLVLITALTLNAQINTNIWGLIVGKSTKQQVKNVIRQKGFTKIYEEGYDYISIEPRNGISFGGVTWDNLGLFFHKNTLCQIVFDYNQNSKSEVYSLMKIKLEGKYSIYKLSETSQKIYFEDNNSNILLTMEFDHILRLFYTNNRLFNLKEQELPQHISSTLTLKNSISLT